MYRTRLSAWRGSFQRRARFTVVAVVLLALAASLLVAGCTSPLAPKPIQITDDLGRAVTISKLPQRIVSLAPSNTEILFALGLGDKVVGVTDADNYPPEVSKIERVGGAYSAESTNFEKIVALKPDLVLTINVSSVISQLDKLGITTVALQPKDLDGVLKDITLVGQITGAESKADELVASLNQRIKAVTDVVQTLPQDQRPTVFYQVSPDLWTTGPGTFQDSIIQMAGGRNVAADLGQPWGQYSLETLVAKNPDVIITPFPDVYQQLKAGTLAGWAAIKAVKTGRVYLIDQDIMSRPGPRLVDALEQVARDLWPDRFH